MGSRVLGGETRRVLTLLFLLHQKKQREEREGEEGWRGMCVCLAEWGKCHVLMRSCLHGCVISLSLFLCLCCSWDEHESGVTAEEDLEQSQNGQV